VQWELHINSTGFGSVSFCYVEVLISLSHLAFRAGK